MAESTAKVVEADDGFLGGIYNEIVASPVNLALLAAIGYLVVKILQGWLRKEEPIPTPPPPPPKMKRQDMTVQELRKYDGNTPDTPILLAVNGKIFNVTKGRRFYGPGGPYEALAGHDASRAFALFQTDSVKEEYDDISDLTATEMQSVKEWEEQLGDKYDFVGKLLKPGEEAGKYSDDEEEKGEESPKEEDKKND
jgi:membrane-associated progesterone receptor component